jgi:S-methylmethionine-dependent homocysteine/selenocysteine methylase
MVQVTVLDGGMGRELLRIGAPFRQPEWSALALTEGLDHVVQAHTNFIEAGAQVITTNSYAVVPFHIGEQRFGEEALGLAALSGRLAREAVASAPHRVLVAGSLPPLFGSYQPELFLASDVPRIIDPLVEGLAEHVDVWLGETLGSIAEVGAVREALDRAGVADRPLWISYTLGDNGGLRSGESVVDAVAAALGFGAEAIMFNCCEAETIGDAISIAVTRADGAAAVGGYANRFVTPKAPLAIAPPPGGANQNVSALRDDLDPSAYCAFVERWLDSGATVVGGCCGIEPAHIARIASLVAQR